ncbi:hypothetical protein AAFF_G00287770 [Aldrovandia affinis]|uniref:Uncharacterized protein n=1 Tax=Aldrovandia affinis TaxID=143900 RepID=A0AAD7SR57_9TELE|nr:hypothetical protein AAFF_G00287770 [Aldrovandia affinis]
MNLGTKMLLTTDGLAVNKFKLPSGQVEQVYYHRCITVVSFKGRESLRWENYAANRSDDGENGEQLSTGLLSEGLFDHR